MSPKNEDEDCIFKYAVKVDLHHKKILDHPERVNIANNLKEITQL